MDALYNVGVTRLLPIEQLGPSDSEVRSGICDFMPFSFEASGKEAVLFMDTERRFAYATPKSYLELINLYTSMVGKKVDNLEDKKERLTNGLDKLRTTETEVAGLEEVLKEKAEAADIFAEEVGIEKTKVQAEVEKGGIVARECAKIAKEVSAQKISCEEDLAKAIPLVKQAEAA